MTPKSPYDAFRDNYKRKILKSWALEIVKLSLFDYTYIVHIIIEIKCIKFY